MTFQTGSVRALHGTCSGPMIFKRHLFGTCVELVRDLSFLKRHLFDTCVRLVWNLKDVFKLRKARIQARIGESIQNTN